MHRGKRFCSHLRQAASLALAARNVAEIWSTFSCVVLGLVAGRKKKSSTGTTVVSVVSQYGNNHSIIILRYWMHTNMFSEEWDSETLTKDDQHIRKQYQPWSDNKVSMPSLNKKNKSNFEKFWQYFSRSETNSKFKLHIWVRTFNSKLELCVRSWNFVLEVFEVWTLPKKTSACDGVSERLALLNLGCAYPESSKNVKTILKKLETSKNVQNLNVADVC